MKLFNVFFELLSNEQCDNIYRCQVKFNPDHRIYKAHFPGYPVTPGVCLMQMGEELLEQKYQKQLQLSVVKSIRFRKIVGPEDTPFFDFSNEVLKDDVLSVEVTIYDEEGESTKMSLLYNVLNEL